MFAYPGRGPCRRSCLDVHLAGLTGGHLTDHAQRPAGVRSRSRDVRRAEGVAVKGRVVESRHVDLRCHVFRGNQPVNLGETQRNRVQRPHGGQNARARLVNGQERVGAGHCHRVFGLLPCPV